MTTTNEPSEKQRALESIKLNKSFGVPIPTKPRNIIKLIKRYVIAGEPIPQELHKMINEACIVWESSQPQHFYKDDAIYDLVYDIKLWSLLNEREGNKRPLEDAIESAKNIHGKKNARDIYKASSKNYKARKKLVEKAKADAVELYNSQNWDYRHEDIL